MKDYEQMTKKLNELKYFSEEISQNIVKQNITTTRGHQLTVQYDKQRDILSMQTEYGDVIRLHGDNLTTFLAWIQTTREK